MGNAREEFGMNDNDRWEVFVLEYANSHEPWVGLVSGMYDAGMVDLPFSFVLARRGEQNVLIDSGFMRQGNEAEFPLKFGVSRWISPLRMLAELGVTPEAVSDIVVTHAPSTIWARSANSPRRASISRSASCCRATRRWRCRSALHISRRSLIRRTSAWRWRLRSSIG